MWNMEIKLLIVITGLLACLVASTSAAMDKKIDRLVYKQDHIFNKYIEPCEDIFYNCKTGRFSIPSIKVKVDKCMKQKKGCNTCRGTGVICPNICDCQECERQNTCSKENLISPRNSNKLVKISEMRVYLGKHHRDDSMDDKAVQLQNIKEIILHPNFHPRSLDSDLALIQMSQAVRFTSRVSPICLPDPNQVDIDKYLNKNYLGVVTGWGIEGKGLKASTVLKYANLPIVDNLKCEEEYEMANIILPVTGNMFCAGHSDGFIGTCGGDSGGAMVFSKGHGKSKTYFLMGVLSWGGVTGCAVAHQFSGFTKISNFLQWIHKYV